MIRCRCGTWSDYGLTCVSCRQDTYRSMSKPLVETEEGEPIELVPLEDDDDIEDED